MIKKSLKKNLLATASVLALGAFASSGAMAAALTGNQTTNVTADDNTTSAAAVILDAVNDGADVVVTENGAGSQVLTQTFDLTLTGTDSNDRAILSNAGANDVEVLVTSGNDATIDLNVNAYGLITTDQAGNIAAAGNAAIAIQHTYGTITVAANGSITSTAENANLIGIKAGITMGGISNAGSIGAHATGTGITVVGDGTTITSGIVNSGTISAGTTGTAITVSGTLAGTVNTTGVINNSGTLTAAGSAGVVTIADVITNAGTGVGFYNSGTVSDTNAGVGLLLSGTVGGTVVTNAGTISTTAGGAAVSTTAALTGTLTNSGTISYVSGDGILTGAAVSKIVNSGVIGVSGTATSGDGLDLNTGVVTLLTNTGTIRTATGIAINADIGVTTLENTGGLIVSTAGTGIDNTGGAITTLTNTGTIQDTTSGTGILVGAAITTFNNTGGTVSSGTGVAMNVDAAITTLTNSGTITSGGAITVDDDGGIATFTNTGTVSQSAGNFAAIDVGAVTTSITNGSSTNATAVISATGTAGAIVVAGGTTGSITNYGIIKNTASSVTAGEAIQISGLLTGGIDNKAGGLITTSGTDAAINNTGNFDITTNITNAGTISSTNGTPVAINLASAAGKAIGITNSGTITGAIALGTTDTITNTGTITGNITEADGATNTINLNGGTVTGNITMDDATDAINFFSSGTGTQTFAGTLGYGVMTATAGTTTLTGVATGVAGSTLTVASGATLYVKSDSSNAAASTITGTLQIGSGKTLTAGTTTALSGTLKVDFTPVDTATGTQAASTFGRYASSGAYTVTGTGNITVNVVGTGFTKAQTVSSIVTTGANPIATGFVDGAALSDNSYVLDFTQVRNGNNIDVAITRANTLQSSSSDINEKGVGAALESIGASGDSGIDAIQGGLQGLSSAGAVESALSTLTPDVSGVVSQAADIASDVAIETVEAHMDMARNEEGTGIATGSRSANSGVWGQVFGTTIDQGDRDGIQGYQANTGGFALGADTLVTDQARVGVSFAYANSSGEGAHSEADIDSYQGSVYGSYDYGKWFSEGLAAFTFNKNSTDRTLFNGTIASADFDGQQYTAKVGGGYKMDVQGGLKVTPRASLKYTFVTTDGYTETGSSANLTVDNADRNILKSSIGVDLDYPIVDGGVTYVPGIRAAWMYDFIGDEQETTSNFTSATGTRFTTNGADVAQSSFKLGAGLDVMAQDNVTVSFDYDWESKEDYNSHTGSLKARFAF